VTTDGRTGVEDFRQRARRRLPRAAFDFVEGGADDEVTLARNRSAFDDLALIPRVLGGVGEVTTAIELFGHQLRMPVLLGPAGAALVAGPDGDAAAARAAATAQTIMVVSWSPTTAGLGATSPALQWYQLYVTRDRGEMADSVRRARELGFAALVLTADVPVVGNRERDQRNRLTVPLRLRTPHLVFDSACRPRWLWQYVRAGAGRGATLETKDQTIRRRAGLDDAVQAKFDPQQTWDDLRRLRDLWDGPLLLKGVMCGDDALLAAEAGCDGVIVSNHGGRQLDGTPASIDVLPEVIAAVSGRIEVLVDGGIRRGTDVVKALSLGAKACLVGRPWVFAVAVGGEAGVTEMLDHLHSEIVRALKLLGARTIDDLGPRFVRRRVEGAWKPIEEIGAIR
jgi:isopentenyl diphosphate isomerase/L-lactate dehydrogenase-like FMN-dependent dehydrogenase